MRIEDAIKTIRAIPKHWVRVSQVAHTPGRLTLFLSIHEESPGRRKLDAWTIGCSGVREANITDFDGGGLALYPSTHPAARRYAARSAKLLWTNSGNTDRMCGALYRAHIDAVDDWIRFDEFAFGSWTRRQLKNGDMVLKGPDFLMKAYAKALREVGENTQLILGARRNKEAKLRVLHFGGSSVVAASFTAERGTVQALSQVKPRVSASAT